MVLLRGLCVLLCLGWLGCGEQPGAPLANAEDTGSIQLELRYAVKATTGAAKIPVQWGRLRVEGEGMAPRDTLLEVFEGRLSARLDGVPAGKRLVFLQMTGADERVLWRAETTVRVHGGQAATALLELDPVGDEPPLVSLVKAPAAVGVGSAFLLEAEMEDVHDVAHFLRARWDFDGDGAFDTDWQASPRVEHAYETEGSFKIVLEVRDRSGFVSRLEHDVLASNVIQDELPGGAAMSLTWIGPGTFLMGSPLREAGRDSDEGPQREVEITRGFYMGIYEVTQAQWNSVMGTEPWKGSGWVQPHARSPATNLTWDMAQEFIARLNEAAGEDLYRLPTEAEWEYAARAGSQTAWAFGDETETLPFYAWTDENTCAVVECWGHLTGILTPNAWGLYDMHGNMWEWVQDWYDAAYYLDGPQVDPQGPQTGAHRVRRGGSFFYETPISRSANRGSAGPEVNDFDFGFRVVRQERLD